MSKVFGDMLTKENMDKAKEELYPTRRMFYKLEDEVENATIGLEELIKAVKKAKKSSLECSQDKEYVERVKKEFDKIAYLIEDFVNEFQIAYEELSPTFVAEKLAGTFDKDQDMIMGMDGASIGSPGKKGWGKNAK